jgi:uncharacterized protein (TIGR03000 family)
VVHHHDAVVHDHPVVHHESVVVNEVIRATPVGTATIIVEVPQDAKVFINGSETKATGTARQFVSKGLKGDASYEYSVRIVTGDSSLEQTKVVKLSRGGRETVKFDGATATAVKPAEPKSDAVATTAGG